MKRKQITLVVKGTQFLDRYTRTYSTDYTIWRVRFNYYPEYRCTKVVDVDCVGGTDREAFESLKNTIKTAEWEAYNQ